MMIHTVCPCFLQYLYCIVAFTDESAGIKGNTQLHNDYIYILTTHALKCNSLLHLRMTGECFKGFVQVCCLGSGNLSYAVTSTFAADMNNS